MKHMHIVAIALSFVASACGGGGDTVSSGLDRTAPVSTLSAGDKTTLCSATLETRGGAGETIDCGNNTTLTNDTLVECEAGLDALGDCDITVGDIEDCANAGSDPCDLEAIFASPACQKLISCESGS